MGTISAGGLHNRDGFSLGPRRANRQPDRSRARNEARRDRERAIGYRVDPSFSCVWVSKSPAS